MSKADAENRMSGADTWLARLHAPDCTMAECAEFERWRAADQVNATAFAQAERIHRRSAELATDPLLQAASRVARRDTARDRERQRRMRSRFLQAAAAVLFLAMGLGAWHHAHRPAVPAQHYATTVGERRTLHLADGSVLLLDTDSAVDVRFDKAGRMVTLQRGRAQFSVALDSQRPFLVRAGDGIIRDIGTRFQVRRDADNVTVALLDGIVSVRLPGTGGNADLESTLAAGQRISFDDHGHFGPVVAIDLEVADGWTRGDLVFKNRKLADLLDEVNRYSDTKIRLGDPALGELAVSGIFHAGDQASLVQALQSGWSLRVEHVSPDGIVLYPGRG